MLAWVDNQVTKVPFSWKYWCGIKFGDLAACLHNHQIIPYLHIHIQRSHVEPPNINPPIFLQRQFGTQLPNLIPANISSYTVSHVWHTLSN